MWERLYKSYKHLDRREYLVHAPKLQWNLDRDVSEEHFALLPEMRTDIVVENSVKDRQLIIDTKFYAESLVSSRWSDIEKILTSHMYQILAYVNSSDYPGMVGGMLLYPTIDKELNA